VVIAYYKYYNITKLYQDYPLYISKSIAMYIPLFNVKDIAMYSQNETQYTLAFWQNINMKTTPPPQKKKNQKKKKNKKNKKKK
jgi:hypothetical protein